METQKGQWEIPDGAYPRESDSKVREPSNKAATADAIAETPADATTEVAATNAMKTDDRASSTAEKDFRTAIATGDIMRADDRSTVAEAAENVATRAGAEATEETAKQDDGAKDNAKTITTVATGEEVDESDNRGTISEFTTVPMADDKNIFVGDRVQVCSYESFDIHLVQLSSRASQVGQLEWHLEAILRNFAYSCTLCLCLHTFKGARAALVWHAQEWRHGFSQNDSR